MAITRAFNRSQGGNGDEIFIDADGDTTITADTDDQIDIKIAVADDFQFTANKFLCQTGSNIDMNGTELILDADADTSITADTDDQIDIKIANVDVAEVTTANSGDLVVFTAVSDKDFVVKGNDGGSTITALTVDMSEAGAATFNNDVTAFSDVALKEDITTIDNALDRVREMRGVFFNRKDTNEENRRTGVIAQEVEKTLPEVVRETDNIKSVAYGNMVGVLIEAIKELEAKIEELKHGDKGQS